MDNLLNIVSDYKLFLLMVALLLLLIIFIISSFVKPKKIKPITITKDDIINEKTEIEKVIEALEENENSRTLTTFEEEQEANAIISYQELVKAVREKKAHMQSKEEKPKFKNSEFISPVFGKENDDFLKELKDFRGNL